MKSKNLRNLSLANPTPPPRLKVVNEEGDVVDWWSDDDDDYPVLDFVETRPGHWGLPSVH